MNEQIKHYRETQTYPCLIFFIQANPDFGKTFTIEDVDKPSEELYNIVLGDFATRGRLPPSYEEWATNCQSGDLQSMIRSAVSELQLNKYAVESFEDIANIKDVNGFIRYADSHLNEHFGVEE
jgi:hypothetical protein